MYEWVKKQIKNLGVPVKNEERIISGEMNIKKMDHDFVEIVKIHP
jgi:hypothetical protein